MPQLSELLAAVDAQGLHRPRALAEALAMGEAVKKDMFVYQIVMDGYVKLCLWKGVP